MLQSSNQQKASFGLDNGLVPNGWQAIISTNICFVYGDMFRHAASMTLM